MANILITGGTGFIGSVLARHIVTTNQVYVTGREQHKLVPGCHYLGSSFHDLHLHDLNLNIIYHCASCTNTLNHDRAYVMKVNYDYSLALLDKAIACGIPSFVYSSSAAVYGHQNDPSNSFRETDVLKPLNVYAESKARLDETIANMNLGNTNVVALRYSNVYGGHDEIHKKRSASMIWQLYRRMHNQAPVLFKWGEQARDFVWIEDVINANCLAAQHFGHGIYNIGSGQLTSFNRIVTLINQLLDKDWSIEYIDNPYQKYYQDYNAINITAAQALGYQPRISDVADGLRKIHAA